MIPQTQWSNTRIATVLNLKGRGLILVLTLVATTAAWVDIVRQAQAVSGVEKVHAMLGGLHLASYKEDYVREVVSEPEEAKPRLHRTDALHRRAIL